MSKSRESAGPDEIQNDIESLSEPSCSVAHLSALEHCTDVCEWTVSGLSWFILGGNSLTEIVMQHIGIHERKKG